MAASDQKEQNFFEKYAQIAMEQQQKYGIPASVTLAQMALESSYGNSRLAKEGQNFFGVKANEVWIKAGKEVSYHSDDKPNEAFRNYARPEDSIEDHSRVLMSDRYKTCRQYSSTDYHNWLVGIKAGGYATAEHYVTTCEKIITQYGLDKYDRQAIQDAKSRGIAIGYMQGANKANVVENQVFADKGKIGNKVALPLSPKEGLLVVTSAYGTRNAPTAGASANHKGLDFRADNATIFATEDNGKVIGVGQSENAGNFVKIEYNREDGIRYQVEYLHLSEAVVSVGDTVTAGQQLGVTGDTGTSTGPHLDFRVQMATPGGELRYIDPMNYLTDLTIKGQLDGVQIVYGGRDLLAEHVQQYELQMQRQQSLAQLTNSSNPSDWLKYLMTNNKDGHLLNGTGDLLGELIGLMFAGLIAAIPSMSVEEKEAIQQRSREDETKIDPAAAIQRQRDGEKLRDRNAENLASLNFDSMTAEQQYQEQSQRIGIS